MVAAYTLVNESLVSASGASPDVERAFRRSAGKRFHMTTDLVWGYTQFLLDHEAQRTLATVSKSGITYPL